MGFYVNVEARKDCADRINELWQRKFEGWLIYTEDIIKKEIEYIANDPEQAGARWIDTVAKWNKAFPIAAEGRGQIFLRTFGYSEERAAEFSEKSNLERQQITWIMQNRLLFERISGLQDAVDALGMEIDCDEFRKGKKFNYIPETFANYPVENGNKAYDLAVEADRPDFWAAFYAWRDEASKDNWDKLKHFPALGDPRNNVALGESVWQRVEKMATARDGLDPGHIGRYRDNELPPQTDVLKAITPTNEEFENLLQVLRRAQRKPQHTKKQQAGMGF